MIEFGEFPGGTYAPDTQMFPGLSCLHAAHRDEFLPLTRLEPSGSAASNRLAFVLTPRSEGSLPFPGRGSLYNEASPKTIPPLVHTHHTQPQAEQHST